MQLGNTETAGNRGLNEFLFNIVEISMNECVRKGFMCGCILTVVRTVFYNMGEIIEYVESWCVCICMCSDARGRETAITDINTC